MTDIARKTAYQTLVRVERDGAYSNLARNTLHKLNGLDASFAEALVLGVLETRRALDHLISRYATKPPKEEITSLLRLGVFQIAYMDRVPDSAACNETVAIAKELFSKPTASFVNAVLRSLCREKEKALQDLGRQPAAVRYSFGDGVAELLYAQYPDQAEEIMRAFGERTPLHLRVNRLKADPLEIASRLGGELQGELLTVRERQSEAVRGAENGEYLIQGYGSQMAVAALGAKKGDFVIDVCACPGGKSFGAALDMQNTGRVLSMDLHENKLSLIRKGATRLGITIIETKSRDARTADPELIGKADRVICDVPCSGLGVLNAKPEIRYKDPTEFSSLYQTQEKILSSSAKYVKNGGTLVYSTCTINKKENEEITHAFLKREPSFAVVEERTYLPYEEACEGFYICSMVKGK